MIEVKQEKAFERLDLLPDDIRNIFFSDSTAMIIRQIAGANHLDEEKAVPALAWIVGYVFLGFIHLDDLAKEIQTELGLSPQLVLSLAEELKRKIFDPIALELEKLYAPPATEELVSETEAPIPTPRAETQEEKIPEIKAEIKTEIKAVELKIKPAEVEPASAESYGEAKPFILHKETPPFAPPSEKTAFKPSFVSKPPVKETLTPKRSVRPPAEKTITAEIEGVSKRIVHYSPFKTPFRPTGEETKNKNK